MGIRDHWTKEDAPAQKSISQLQKLLGIDVLIEPEWPLLLADLDALHPDRATFVPSVAGCVQGFCEAMNGLVEDESMAEWSDTLLEKAEGKIRAFIEVSTYRDRPTSGREGGRFHRGRNTDQWDIPKIDVSER